MKARSARALGLSLVLILASLAVAQNDDLNRASRPSPETSSDSTSGFPFRDSEMRSRDQAPQSDLVPVRANVRRLNRVDCSVVDWQGSLEVPVLRLLCPTEKMFAPLRLVLRVTWSGKDKMPKEAAHIVDAKPRTQTRLMFSEASREWRVWLDVKDENGKNKGRWITFDAVAGTTMIAEQ